MEIKAILISFLISVSGYVVNLSIPLYLISKFTAPPIILGISGFFGNFAYTLFTYIFYKTGFLFNFPSFIFSTFLISTIYFLLPFCPHYKYMFFLFFLNGIFYSKFWPSIQYFFGKRKNLVDKFNFSWSTGVIVGLFISGYLFKLKQTLPFWIGSLLAFISFILGIIHFENFNDYYKNLSRNFKLNRKLDIHTKRILTLNFSIFFAIGGTLFLFPKLGKTLDYPSTVISNLLTYLFFVRLLSFYLLSKIEIFNIENKIPFFYFLVSLSLFLCGTFKSPILHLIPFTIIGLSSAFSYRLAIINILKKGYSTELNESIIGIGFFTGPLIIGFLGQISGIFKGFILGGFIILFIFIFGNIKGIKWYSSKFFQYFL